MLGKVIDAQEQNKPELLNRASRQFRRHIEEPIRKKKQSESDE
jgi:hypothetical protein